jgi:hypothetical protein
MDLDSAWQKALKQTQIVRSRVKPLLTFETTQLPYVFLAASSVNRGDTVVRQGEVAVEKPSIVLPQNLPHFEGFDFDKDYPVGASFIDSFFLVRGVRFPSLRYNNKTNTLDVFEGSLENATGKYLDQLARGEDVRTGLVTGPEDCWQFSIMIFIVQVALRQAGGDVRGLLDKFLG